MSFIFILHPTDCHNTHDMGLIDSFFGSSGNTPANIQWNQLDNVQQLDDIVKESATKPAVIFKHSTSCSISRMALKQFEREYGLHDKVTPYFLDLLENREISNLISDRFNVVHQSPQILLIKNGQAVYDASHSDIDADALARKIDTI